MFSLKMCFKCYSTCNKETVQIITTNKYASTLNVLKKNSCVEERNNGLGVN